MYYKFFPYKEKSLLAILNKIKSRIPPEFPPNVMISE
jgi:hypothetical protein